MSVNGSNGTPGLSRNVIDDYRSLQASALQEGKLSQKSIHGGRNLVKSTDGKINL